MLPSKNKTDSKFHFDWVYFYTYVWHHKALERVMSANQQQVGNKAEVIAVSSSLVYTLYIYVLISTWTFPCGKNISICQERVCFVPTSSSEKYPQGFVKIFAPVCQ